MNNRLLFSPCTKSLLALVASIVDWPDPPAMESRPVEMTRSWPLPNWIAFFPPPAAIVALAAPCARMISLPLPVLSDQLSARDPEIANLLSPPPATTVPEPAEATKVKEVWLLDMIVSSAAPEPKTMADPGFVTRSVV
jgi:hypothetical protein